MDPETDYYLLLHVQPDAPEPVIKASYRAMMQKLRHHPDLGGEPSVARQLNEAIAILCDPERRSQYDQRRRKHAESLGAATDVVYDTRETTSRTAAKQRPSNSAPNPSPKSSSNASADWSSDTANGETSTESAYEATPMQLPTRPHCPFCLANYHRPGDTGLPYTAGNLCTRCQGPTTPVERLPPAHAAELRGIYRQDHRAAVTLWASWPMTSALQATMCDFSVKGCAVDSATALATGHVLLLHSDALQAICQVRHCQQLRYDDRFAIGLAFLTLQVTSRPGAVFSVSV